MVHPTKEIQQNTEYSNERDADNGRGIVDMKTNLPKRPMTTANPGMAGRRGM